VWFLDPEFCQNVVSLKEKRSFPICVNGAQGLYAACEQVPLNTTLQNPTKTIITSQTSHPTTLVLYFILEIKYSLCHYAFTSLVIDSLSK
jgi:hypothetical protein